MGQSPSHPAAVWASLATFAALAVGMVVLYPDGYQQDAGHHFLFARAAWEHPTLFVSVWNRPLFTALYSVPAIAGYPAAKLLTVVIALASAFETYRLARQLGVPRSPLVITLLFLQPSYFMLCSETMTEPLLALVFVVALRLRASGRAHAGMLVASLMVLARPEGFFLALLWGVWIFFDAGERRPLLIRALRVLPLGAGAFVWWLAALVITGDALFIRHNWPPNWDFTSAVYGVGPAWTYVARLPEIAGPILAFVFLLGLLSLVARRQLTDLTSAVLMLFVLHTILRAFGWLGSAGYARYFVCVSPAVAIITLVGWQEASERFAATNRLVRRTVAALVLGLSAASCVLYVDMAGFYDRDSRAVSDMHRWFLQQPRPVTRLIWSQSYMCIVFRCDPMATPAITGDRAVNLDLIRDAPAGTLAFWDSDTGPSWFKLIDADFEAAGYERLLSRDYALDGWLQESRWLRNWKPRPQRMHLLYKRRGLSPN